jgi:hypothetical protein
MPVSIAATAYRRIVSYRARAPPPRSYDILRILAKITARNANISRIKA